MENKKKKKTIIFDFNNSLTSINNVTNIKIFHLNKDYLSAFFSLTNYSDYPLNTTISNLIKNKNPTLNLQKVKGFREKKGYGISGLVEKETFFVEKINFSGRGKRQILSFIKKINNRLKIKIISLLISNVYHLGVFKKQESIIISLIFFQPPLSKNITILNKIPEQLEVWILSGESEKVISNRLKLAKKKEKVKKIFFSKNIKEKIFFLKKVSKRRKWIFLTSNPFEKNMIQKIGKSFLLKNDNITSILNFIREKF